MRRLLLIFSSLVLLCGCASPTIESDDSKANYGYVFSDVTAPEPTIIRSRVERERRSVFGLFPLRSQYNGDWEFELVASSAWVQQVKAQFTPIQFTDVWPRQVPDWFRPFPDKFSAWRMQRTSYPNAHLFIEKNPSSQDEIRVFIRRH